LITEHIFSDNSRRD